MTISVIVFAHCIHVVCVRFKRGLAVQDDIALLFVVDFVQPDLAVFTVVSFLIAVAPVRLTSATTGTVAGDTLSFA